MQWIHEYQLFLFDFDGLLVNTEETHFLAYKKMCQDRGFNLSWDFNLFCQAAHYAPAGTLGHQIYAALPELQAQEPNWKVLYAEKQQAVHDLLAKGVSLMPGVTALLQALDTAGIARCVVTNSPTDHVNLSRQQNPILNTIPVWITREHYSQPKPNPECYLKAIERLAKSEDRVIGFEDTPRGLRALMGTRAKPMLICQVDYPEIPDFIKTGVAHYPSFEHLN